MIKVRRKITEFISEKYRKKGAAPSARQNLQEFGPEPYFVLQSVTRRPERSMRGGRCVIA
jgi:hypothetical protein